MASLPGYSGHVEDSGEGRWTVQAAIEEAVPAEVLTSALYTRFRSRQDHTFAEKVLSAMRKGFGGHVEPKASRWRGTTHDGSRCVIVLMGVSGCGKSTVGAELSQALGWPFRDADSFHPPANIEKMSRGIPLTDDDRWPWLDAIGAWIDERSRAGEPGIVSCSALKRAYRDAHRRPSAGCAPGLSAGQPGRDRVAARGAQGPFHAAGAARRASSPRWRSRARGASAGGRRYRHAAAPFIAAILEQLGLPAGGRQA